MQLAAGGHSRHRARPVGANGSRRLRENLARTGLSAELVARATLVDWQPKREFDVDPARRALLGDRHVPPPPRGPVPRPSADHRRGGAELQSKLLARAARLAAPRRRARLFGLLARAAGRREQVVSAFLRRNRAISESPLQPGEIPRFRRRPSPKAGCESCPACSKLRAVSTASSPPALSAPR